MVKIHRFFGALSFKERIRASGKIRFIPAFFVFMICVFPAFSVNVPSLKGCVNDYAKIIRDSDEREIEEYLAGVEESSGIQIAVLTMSSLDGDDISSFGIKVAEKWKLGDKEKDNGAILIVAYAEHDLRIEVGDGLEGSLTDAKCGLILRNVIIPEFKNGNYSAGIKKGVQNMGAIATGDESAVSKSVRDGKNNSDSDVVPVFVILVWMLIFVGSITAGARRGRGRRRGRYYYNGNTMAWIAADAALRSMMKNSGSSHGSGFGGSGHSGGFGGFSGGGGHFSGGGASAHW